MKRARSEKLHLPVLIWVRERERERDDPEGSSHACQSFSSSSSSSPSSIRGMRSKHIYRTDSGIEYSFAL